MGPNGLLRARSVSSQAVLRVLLGALRVSVVKTLSSVSLLPRRLLDLKNGFGDVVHIGARGEQHVLRQPDRLVLANALRDRTGDRAVVVRGGERVHAGL